MAPHHPMYFLPVGIPPIATDVGCIAASATCVLNLLRGCDESLCGYEVEMCINGLLPVSNPKRAEAGGRWWVQGPA